jgi:hypothetical protein
MSVALRNSRAIFSSFRPSCRAQAGRTAGFNFWKHDRQSTGRPCVGLNGTVVSEPHSEQEVRVSGRTLAPPLARLALHCLQRLGSFVNFLSTKKVCSPAVKMKSAPQSMHFRTLSWYSMAGSPWDREIRPIGHEKSGQPARLPVFLTPIRNKGPGRKKSAAANQLFRDSRITCLANHGSGFAFASTGEG